MARADSVEKPVFCVLVPHFKDDYWLSVGYGLQQTAGDDVTLLFYEAGGYRALPRQIAQLQTCTARGVDAVLIGAVSSDDSELLAAVADVAGQIPVFGLVNALHSDALRGRIGVDWRRMGLILGRDLATRHPAGSPPRKAALITGPPESGWPAALLAGLRDGLRDSSVTLVEVLGADTGLRQQLALVEDVLIRHPDIDYLLGSAPAIEAALGLTDRLPPSDRPDLIATYISHTVKRGLINGRVASVPFDDPVRQGAMAIRQARDTIARKDAAGTTGPAIRLLTRTDKALRAITLAPADYFPTIR